MQDQQVKDLLQLIDKQQAVLVQKENIFDTPVRIYMILKTMYQNYKKNHELQIMQARIFEITLKQNPNQQITLTKVSAASLFQYHSLNQKDIMNLISMKDYLKQNSKQELYDEILKGIQKQSEVRDYMKCYRTLLNNEFMNKDMQTYKKIEDKMINKLLTLQLLRGKDIRIIGNNLLALPKIQQPILFLISKLYQITQNLNQFKMLFLIFLKNFPSQPGPTDIEALIRIALPQTLVMMTQYYENNNTLRPIIFQAAQKQAKHKLSTMELTLTSKTIHILNFIVEVVKLGIPIWQQIIEWQHKAAQELKNILKNQLQGILVAMMKEFRCFETVIAIIEKITDIDEHSEIGLIFVRELLKLQSKQYLNHRIVRKFLALKILKYNSSEEYVKQIFGKNLRFIEVILQMFNYKSNCSNFYNHILSSQTSLQAFDAYLSELLQKMPVKLKQFFIKCTLADSQKNQLFGQINSPMPMLKIMGEKMTIEIAASYVRDLALFYPSKGTINILQKLLTVFKDNKQISILKSNVVRSLNITLIRTPKHLISKTFQIYFPRFLKNYLMKEYLDIFVDVPEETNKELKKNYDLFKSKHNL